MFNKSPEQQAQAENKKWLKRLNNEEMTLAFIEEIVAAGKKDLLEQHWQTKSYYERSGLLRHIAGRGTPAVLAFLNVIDCKKMSANELAEVACYNYTHSNGDLSVTQAVLEAGMNVNYNNASLMCYVLNAGQIDLAKRIIEEYPFETAYFETHVYPYLLDNSASPEAMAFAKQYAGKNSVVASGETRFDMADDISVICVQPLPNNGQLMMMFNFATAQQILIPQAGGQVAAATVVEFDKMKNQTLLKAAASAFIDAGGSADLVKDAGIILPAQSKRAMTV